MKLQRAAHWLKMRRASGVARGIELAIRLCYGAHIPAGVRLGMNVHFGHNGLATIINANCRIGSNCFIGSHTIIGGNSTEEGVPTIEDDVVIHAASLVIGPVTIGRGAVIAAGSLVNANVPAYSLVMGRPARVVKRSVDPSRYAMH